MFVLLDTVTTFHLQSKIFPMTFDNASNNTVVVDNLKVTYKPICNGDRCVATRY